MNMSTRRNTSESHTKISNKFIAWGQKQAISTKICVLNAFIFLKKNLDIDI